MSQPVITVEGLGKRYTLHHQARPGLLRDQLASLLRNPFRREKGAGNTREEFWALKDVNFTVNQGDVLGIVGRNGAGKSTLLKILSRITEPTTGRITIRGRVASLLEVGTGFHGELSGRENIYLNGAILGMTRQEIRKKFDEIVAFSEVEKFLDTPVKHYSSGMYVRLAFAVAAHLEPEILIVDEVLAVGDIAFQKKCIGKMHDVSRTEGRTVLFVSHNLPSVRQLCRSAILFAGGRVQAAGPCANVLELYQHGLAGASPTSVPPPTPDLRERAYVTKIEIETLDCTPSVLFPVGRPWRARVGFRIVAAQHNFVISIGLKAADGTAIQTAWLAPQDLAPGDYAAEFVQDRVVLEAGAYTLLVGLSENDRGLQQFEATRIDFSGDDATGYYPGTSGFGLVLNSMQTSLRKL
jgi:lipopolysaccharide transport system ATP-binding protein